MEEKLNIPISPFMARRSDLVSKCQMTFISFVVSPLWEAWAAYDSSQEPHLHQLKVNYEEWARRDRNSVDFLLLSRTESKISAQDATPDALQSRPDLPETVPEDDILTLNVANYS
eukprot:TRINITY_DN5167_c0_g1_i3.p1 TRINITY_DN5167_c0_g1~~TRINITY_DN5167_c0_g1_i3.p1  ORF type:complete len:115 (-),score=17.69 TRINITY_DN5167_c0_g1_i3:113-457(-)